MIDTQTTYRKRLVEERLDEMARRAKRLKWDMKRYKGINNGKLSFKDKPHGVMYNTIAVDHLLDGSTFDLYCKDPIRIPTAPTDKPPYCIVFRNCYRISNGMCEPHFKLEVYGLVKLKSGILEMVILGSRVINMKEYNTITKTMD